MYSFNVYVCVRVLERDSNIHVLLRCQKSLIDSSKQTYC